jgi:phospholipid/cholesterol/gamma-HCH transport system ATP-binding protein
MTAAGDAIRITGLSTAFGDQVVLAGIDLRVAAGESLVVLGRSGTGKSVLLRHLIGLQRPDAGSVQVLGQELKDLVGAPLSALRQKIGFVFQTAALYDSMSVLGNVDFPLRYLTTQTAGERRERAMALLERVGLAEAADKLPTEISGGMRKRAGLARALALEPSLMLYDEPTAGLDPITSREITELMLKLQQERGLASVIVTHDMASARAVADRVALLDQGAIVFDGPFADLRDSTVPLAALFADQGPSEVTHD